MSKKNGNNRCPLQAECERKCAHKGHELDCDYYSCNARGELMIEDQEAIRSAREREREEQMLAELYGTEPDGEDPADVSKMVMLPIAMLYPHPDNPRKELGDLTELADSIRAKGVFQNLTVVPFEDGYRIIIGHRRRAASELAGLTHLPCVIVDMSPKEQVATMLLENMQRSDLTHYEQAEGFQMMLDLGETVNTISEQTGLSESTIRRRVKLTELDRDALKKAEARGGTMKDYEKLSKIEDPERRNEVLAKVGTNNFNEEYAKAIRDQNDRKFLRETAETLRQCGWAKEVTLDELDPLKGSGKVDWYRNFGSWRKEPPVEPEDAGQRQYYFIVYEGRQIDMYRDHIHVDPVETEGERLKRELRTELDRIEEELELQEQDFRDLRESFVEDFSKFNTYDDEIVAFAVRAVLCRLEKPGYQAALDLEAWSAMLNVGEENGVLDEKDVDRALLNRPREALLFTAYYLLEDGNRKTNDTVRNSGLGMRTPIPKEDKKLCLLYDCLRCLGYAWSTEEQRAVVGDSSLLQEARALIEKYKREAGITG